MVFSSSDDIEAAQYNILTQTPGYASSSNTLATGAQGGEHSATFNDPGVCATNVKVYPIGTLIYVVVRAVPYIPPRCTYPLSYRVLS